jgi:hypothetical protein
MKRALQALMVFCLTITAAPAHAFESRAGSSINVSEPVSDDLYAAGGTVEVTAEVDGDVVATGGTILLSGRTNGGILAAGGTVRIGGTVGRSVRAAAGTLTVDGRVGSDAVIAGGNVDVVSQANIGRDLVAAGGNVEVAGGIGRNAILSGGNVTIGGTVQGNVEVQAGRLVVLPAARIAGSLRNNGDARVDIQQGAQISGGVQRTAAMRRRGSMGSGLGGRIVELLWLLVVGFVLIALAPGAVWRVSARVGRQFWLNLLTGFILLVCVPVAAILMLITIVGIPLAVLVMALYLATLYLGQVAVAGWAGARIFSGLQRGGARSPYLAYAIGAIILVVLFALPFLGPIARLVALLVGFGALWAAAWGLRRPSALATPASAGT